MSETRTSTAPAQISRKPGSPIWVDTYTPDVEAAIGFYTRLFGWNAEPEVPDAGGYRLFTIDGGQVAAVGPLQEGQFPAWITYFATPDADATAAEVQAAGGKVIMPPFDVLTSGRMAVFQDPVGAFFSIWQPFDMKGFDRAYEPNTFSWTELNCVGVDRVTDFYTQVFGWSVKEAKGGDGSPPYTEWQIDGKSIGGAMDLANLEGMSEVPPFWLVYFGVSDIDATAGKVKGLGGTVNKGPEPYPGGKFAIISDPNGVVFGLMESSEEG